MASGNKLFGSQPAEMHIPSGSLARKLLIDGLPSVVLPQLVSSELIIVGSVADTLSAGGNVTLVVVFESSSATGNTRLQAEIARITNDTNAWNSGSATGWGTKIAATVAAPSAVGQAKVATIALTNAQASALAAGDFAAIRLTRLGTDALDTLAADIMILGAYLKET